MDVNDLFYLFTLRYIPTEEHQVVTKQVNELDLTQKSMSIALSGGIDSSYLLHVMKMLSGGIDMEGICIDFVDSTHTEVKLAQEIADKYDIKLKVVTVDDPLADLKYLISIVGEPRINLYQYYLYKESRKNLVTGDGADETYCGYTFRYKKYLDNLSKCNNTSSSSSWQERVKLYLQCHANDWVPDQELVFNPKFGILFSWDKILEYFRQFFYSEFKDNPLHPVIMADMSGKLRYDFVPMNKKLSESVGVQLIAPFLEEYEIRKAADIPVNERYNYETNMGKLPLRKMINRMDTYKKGFSFDIVSYYARKGFDLVHSTINKDSRVFDYISRDWYNNHISDTDDIRYVMKYLQIYALELYLQLVEEERVEVSIQSRTL